jgi:hypothetical protein
VVLVLSRREVADLAPLRGGGGDWVFVHRSGAAFVFVDRRPLPAAAAAAPAAE